METMTLVFQIVLDKIQEERQQSVSVKPHDVHHIDHRVGRESIHDTEHHRQAARLRTPLIDEHAHKSGCERELDPDKRHYEQARLRGLKEKNDQIDRAREIITEGPHQVLAQTKLRRISKTRYRVRPVKIHQMSSVKEQERSILSFKIARHDHIFPERIYVAHHTHDIKADDGDQSSNKRLFPVELALDPEGRGRRSAK